MKLQEIFDQLTTGELSQLSIGGQAAGVIDESNWAKVLPHINLALTTLYKRFLIKEGRLLVELVPDRAVYTLKSQFSQANTRSRELVKYILDDAAAPFKDDIVQITQVLVESNTDLSLNDTSDELSVIQTSATTLRVPLKIVNKDKDLPDWLKTDTLQVVYQADASRITIPAGFFDPSRVEVELPYGYLEALGYFVASRVTSPMGTGQFEGLAGNNWYSRFEAACSELIADGMYVDRNGGDDKMQDRGFP